MQNINKLASGVHELVQVNAKRLKVENQDQQQLLEFCREEAENTQQHEKEMAELYLEMMIVQQSNNLGISMNKAKYTA